MSLIDNERTKLLANTLDRASTAFLTVGVLTPGAGLLYGIIKVTEPATLSKISAFFSVWVYGAWGLHLLARRVLGGLK